jgi:GT2 family glycosyltransferase
MTVISIVLIVKSDIAVKHTLNALMQHKSDTQFEVIVVANVTRGDNLEIDFPKIKLIKYTNKLKKITIPEQRNIGFREAKTNIIVFLDASCIPSPGWLESLFNEAKKGEKIVAGFVKPTDKSTINNISGSLGESPYLEECPTANVLIDRRVFESIGGFDESFEYGSDTDFMWRARNAGFKIKYEKSAVVTHEWGKISAQFVRSYRYGKARAQLYIKHKDRYQYLIKKDMILLFYPAFILCLPLVFFSPLYFLLLLIPVIKNRNNSPIMQVILNLIFGLGVLSKCFQVFLEFSKRLLVPKPS